MATDPIDPGDAYLNGLAAQRTLGAAQQSTPQQGAQAVQYGPQVGLHPDAALTIPADVQAQAMKREQLATIAGSPALQSAIPALGVAHTAAMQDDFGSLANIAHMIISENADVLAHPSKIIQSFGAYADPRSYAALGTEAKVAGQTFAPFADIANAAGGAWQAWQREAEREKSLPLGLPRLASVGQQALDALGILSSPFAAVSTPLGKGIAAGVENQVQSGQIGQEQFDLIGQTPEQRARTAAAYANLITMALPLPELPRGLGFGKSAEAADSAFHPTPPSEPPHLGPDGRWATTAEGHVADATGAPVNFASAKDAGLWYHREGYASGTDQIFQPASGEEPGTFRVQETGRTAAPVADVPAIGVHPGVDAVRAQVAEWDAMSIAQMRSEIEKSTTFARSPDTMKAFLEHQTNSSVEIDPEALVKLAQDGHEPFPALASQIQQAALYGESVRVSLVEYLVATAKQPFAQELDAASTFREGGTSVAEAKETPTVQPEEATHKVIILHGGGDFDELNSAMFGTGEPGGIRPLGKNSLYGGLAVHPDDLETATELAKVYTKYGGKTPTIHAFEMQLPSKITNLNYENNPKGWARTGEDNKWEAEALPWTHKVGAKTAKEIAVKDIANLKRIGKWSADTPTDTIVQHLQTSFTKPKLPAPEMPKDFTPEEAYRGQALAASARDNVSRIVKAQYLEPLFNDARALGMNKSQLGRWSDRLEAQVHSALEREYDRVYRSVRAERGEPFKAAAAAHAERIEGEINALPNVRAMRALSEPGFKLDSGAVADFYPEPASRLPKGILKANANHPDNAADQLGYGSGAELVNDLADLHSAVVASGQKGLNAFVKWQAREAGKAVARSELGFDLSPDELHEAASAAVNTPALEDHLADEVRELAQQLGLGKAFDRAKFNAISEAHFEAKTVAQARNIKAIERLVGRATKKAEIALQKGDYLRGFQWAQIRALQQSQLVKAHEFAREFKSANRVLDRVAKNNVVPGTDANVGAIVQQEVAQARSISRDQAELARFVANGPYGNGPNLALAMTGNGIPTSYTPAFGPIESTPVAAFRDWTNMIKSMIKYGKDIHEVEEDGHTHALTDLANNVTANGQALGVKYTPDQLQARRREFFGQRASKAKSVLVGNLRPEVYLHWADGSEQGPLMRSVVNPMMQGKYTETDLTDSWVKAMKAVDAEGGNFYRSMHVKMDVPALMEMKTRRGNVQVIRTRGDLRSALLHLGEDSARTKLLDGFGWGEEQEQWLLDNATEQDWKFARAFWDENAKLFAQRDAMYGRVRGYGVKAEPARDVDTGRFGVIPGGHVKIQYDQTLANLAKITARGEEDLGELLTGAEPPNPSDILGSHPASALPSSTGTIERTKYTGPVQLDYRYLSSGVAEMIHDIAFREPIIQAQKVLSDPRVKATLQSTLGPEYEAQMMPWLRYVAQQKMLTDPATEAIAKMTQGLLSNAVWAKVAFNMSSALLHSGVGLAHMTTEVGNPLAIAEAANDIMGVGAKAKAWREFVDTKSGEVRGMGWNVDASLQDAMVKDALTGGAVADYKKAGYWLFTMSKQLEGRITWLAKYRLEMAKHGVDADAVAVADKAVRDTQGAGHAVDLPPLLQHGNPFRILAGQLMGFRNTTANRLFTIVRSAGQARRGNAEFGQAAAASAAGFILIPALWTALYHGFVRGEQAAPSKGKPKPTASDTFFHNFAWGLMDQTAGSFVGSNVALAQAQYGGTGGGEDFFSSIEHDVHQAFDIKNHRWLTNAMTAVGELTGVIPQSAARAVQATEDNASGMRSNHQPLPQSERGVVPFTQRAVLGRSPRKQ